MSVRGTRAGIPNARHCGLSGIAPVPVTRPVCPVTVGPLFRTVFRLSRRAGNHIANRKSPDPEPRVFKHNNTAGLKQFRNSCQVREQQGRLPFCGPVSTLSKEDDRRLSRVTQCEQRSKIGVCRYHNPIVGLGALKNYFISGGLQAKIADMDGVVTGISQPIAEYGRQGIVHEKFHGTVSGISRSRTASAA
jgi:hypothetical protein